MVADINENQGRNRPPLPYERRAAGCLCFVIGACLLAAWLLAK